MTPPLLRSMLKRRLSATLKMSEEDSELLLQRREVLLAGTAGLLGTIMPSWIGQAIASRPVTQTLIAKQSTPVPNQPDEHLWIPQGYRATRLISWGDQFSTGQALPIPLVNHQDQLTALGYNNDFITYHALTPQPNQKRRALLSINHEYTCPSLMFPGAAPYQPQLELEQYRIEMASVGHSVIEIAEDEQGWQVVWNSSYARRLSALGPRIELSGPVRGHERVKTKRDPEGLSAMGTFANCAGGQTPWGTTLIAEENINQQFYGDPDALIHEGESATREIENLKRIDIAKGGHGTMWHLVDPRFDIRHDPREPNAYGWIVELNPYDPKQAPVKRTALGRFKHECATCALTTDGRVVVYSGDDQQGEHLYRFITQKEYQPKVPQENWGLLDEGTLQVARFEDDGRVQWLDLVFGEGPLTAENRFYSQADVLIETRRAATLMGATPLDRPEDVEVSPTTGHVYVMLTQHKSRSASAPASPRAPNPFGHILEITLAQGDHGSSEGTWDVVHLGGPKDQGGSIQEGREDWIRNPDNGTFDPLGRLWVTADAHSNTKPAFANGLWCCEVEGIARGQAQRIVATPIGAEPCGPCFTPEGDALFVSIQHPGEGSTWDEPSTRWPDFRSDLPPRPSVVVIEREQGGLLVPRIIDPIPNHHLENPSETNTPSPTEAKKLQEPPLPSSVVETTIKAP